MVSAAILNDFLFQWTLGGDLCFCLVGTLWNAPTYYTQNRDFSPVVMVNAAGNGVVFLPNGEAVPVSRRMDCLIAQIEDMERRA